MNELGIISIGLLIPFLGTTLGSACVFFMRDKIKASLESSLLGFASGIMMSASVFSLLLPAIEMKDGSPFAATFGFMAGIGFLLLMDRVIPHLHSATGREEGLHARLKRTTMLVFAVTLHNIPEGMAVGVVFAGMANGGAISVASALALSIGIALQNFPEGAIISLPLKSSGGSKSRAFALGTLSGAVEPVFAALTILIAGEAATILPFILSFAAGAMVYVIVEELLPESSGGKGGDAPVIAFALGFALMMTLDCALG